MHGKKRTGEVAVTESVVQAALRRGPALELASDEEKVIRMRVGASLPLSARLEQLALATDTEIEVLAYEIEAYLRLQERARAAGPSTVQRLVPTSRPTSSRTKEKIIRALRKKP